MYAICFILCVTIFMLHVIFTVYALFIFIIFQYLILLVSVIIIVDGDAEKFFLKSDQMSEIWGRASCLSLALFSTPRLFLFFFYYYSYGLSPVLFRSHDLNDRFLVHTLNLNCKVFICIMLPEDGWKLC